MTVIEGRTCYAYFRGKDGCGTCDDRCQWYSSGEPCPMWIPMRFWYKDVCTVCRRKGEKCDMINIRAVTTGDMIACYGFEEEGA